MRSRIVRKANVLHHDASIRAAFFFSEELTLRPFQKDEQEDSSYQSCCCKSFPDRKDGCRDNFLPSSRSSRSARFDRGANQRRMENVLQCEVKRRLRGPLLSKKSLVKRRRSIENSSSQLPCSLLLIADNGTVIGHARLSNVSKPANAILVQTGWKTSPWLF